MAQARATLQREIADNKKDLFDTSWRTAERTGALSHMDYAEVQRYSMLAEYYTEALQ